MNRIILTEHFSRSLERFDAQVQKNFLKKITQLMSASQVELNGRGLDLHPFTQNKRIDTASTRAGGNGSALSKTPSRSRPRAPRSLVGQEILGGPGDPAIEQKCTAADDHDVVRLSTGLEELAEGAERVAQRHRGNGHSSRMIARSP